MLSLFFGYLKKIVVIHLLEYYVKILILYKNVYIKKRKQIYLIY